VLNESSFLIDSDSYMEINARLLSMYLLAHDDGSRSFLQTQQTTSTSLQYHVSDFKMHYVLHLQNYDYAAYYVG
jgi:hypothetical protein